MNRETLCVLLLVFVCASCQIAKKDTLDQSYPAMVSIHLADGREIKFAKYPITVQQFSRFVSSSNYLTDAEKNLDEGCWGVREDKTVGWMPYENWHNNRLNQAQNHPVVCVSWNDATAYAKWLSSVTGDTYRLPKIIEWEYAASGGSGKKYYFGDDEKEVCKYINHADTNFLNVFNEHALISECDDGYGETSPVGAYFANRYGLFDMYGNVWEWQLDCVDGKIDGSVNCSKQALKGASYASNPNGIVVGYQVSGKRETRTSDYGFRVVKTGQ